MDVKEIERRIGSFPSWHYEFDLKGRRTPVSSPKVANRHERRRRYFFDPVVTRFGGSLSGKRVLDLGCNAGFWSLEAIKAGCDFVLGVDGRETHVEQARFVFAANEVNPARYQFVCANVFDLNLQRWEPFDLVLCLGLIYHVSRPVSLFQAIAAANTELLVVDTRISNAPGSYLELGRESIEPALNAVDCELKMQPTPLAMADMAGQFGYVTLMLKPRFRSWEGCRDFRFVQRRAFLCAKDPAFFKWHFDAEDMTTLRFRAKNAVARLAVAARDIRRRRHGLRMERLYLAR